jgi:predicted oxidoreductase
MWKKFVYIGSIGSQNGATARQTGKEAIVLVWLLRHPEAVYPIN